jgi:hypothetical protein
MNYKNDLISSIWHSYIHLQINIKIKRKVDKNIIAVTQNFTYFSLDF